MRLSDRLRGKIYPHEFQKTQKEFRFDRLLQLVFLTRRAIRIGYVVKRERLTRTKTQVVRSRAACVRVRVRARMRAPQRMPGDQCKNVDLSILLQYQSSLTPSILDSHQSSLTPSIPIDSPSNRSNVPLRRPRRFDPNTGCGRECVTCVVIERDNGKFLDKKTRPNRGYKISKH
jgi:hypothetical protein